VTVSLATAVVAPAGRPVLDDAGHLQRHHGGDYRAGPDGGRQVLALGDAAAGVGLASANPGIMTIRTVFTLATGNTLSILLSGAIITLTLTAVVATVVWSVIVGRQEGLLRPGRTP
jgi:hypothetical protein